MPRMVMLREFGHIWRTRAVRFFMTISVAALSACPHPPPETSESSRVSPPTCEGPWGAAGDPLMCNDTELLQYIDTIDRACNNDVCDSDAIRELDSSVSKAKLMPVLGNPNLGLVSLFYPRDRDDITQTFEWRSRRHTQIQAFKNISSDSVSIYILGRASKIGDVGYNVGLSRRRAINVRNYLKELLGGRCSDYHVAWVGRDTLQLDRKDAASLGIPEIDYQDDLFVLNQSVQVFVFPCKHALERMRTCKYPRSSRGATR